jgi:hypothetical protein
MYNPQKILEPGEILSPRNLFSKTRSQKINKKRMQRSPPRSPSRRRSARSRRRSARSRRRSARSPLKNKLSSPISPPPPYTPLKNYYHFINTPFDPRKLI